MAERRLISGICWSATQNASSQVISFLVFLLLARLLTPETFGLMAMVYVFVSFAEIFIDQGFSEAIVQRRRIRSEHLDTAFWCSLAFGVLCVVAGLLGAPLVAALFGEPAITPMVAWVSIGFLCGGLRTVPVALLRRHLKFRAMAIAGFAGTVAGGIVGVVMALADFGVWSLVGHLLATSLVKTGAAWIASGWTPGWRFHARHLRELVSFGAHIVGFNLAGFANRRGDDMIIGICLGPVALGIYTIAYRVLQSLTRLLLQTINAATFPVFASLQQQPERLRRAYCQSLEFSAMVAFPVFFAVSALAPELIETMCGPQWRGSATVLRILALVGAVHAVCFVSGAVMLAMGKPQWRTTLNVIHSVANILMFLGVVRWGINAIAAAYVGTALLLLPAYIVLANRLVGLSFSAFVRRCAVSLAASLLMLVVLLAVRFNLPQGTSSLLSLTILVPVGVATFAVAVIAFAPERVAQAVAALRQMIGVRRGLKV